MGNRVYVYRDPRIERFATPGRHDVHIDSAMTNISIAYRNTGYIADKIFPNVPVNHQSDKYFKFEKDSWFRDEAGVRAPGTRAPRVEYAMDQPGNYACIEYAAAKGVPDETVLNADNPLRPDRTASEFVTDKLMLRKEKDVADLVNTSGNWTTSGSPTGGQWNDDTSDPISDVTGSSGVHETIRGLIGLRPNTCVMGAAVWAALKRHPDFLDRIKYTQRGVLTVEIVKELLEVQNLYIGDPIINSGKEGATASYADIWGKYCWFGWVPPNPSLDVPAAGYVITWKKRQINRYREDQEHQDVVECLENWDSKVTCADAGYLLTSVVA